MHRRQNICTGDIKDNIVASVNNNIKQKPEIPAPAVTSSSSTSVATSAAASTSSVSAASTTETATTTSSSLSSSSNYRRIETPNITPSSASVMHFGWLNCNGIRGRGAYLEEYAQKNNLLTFGITETGLRPTQDLSSLRYQWSACNVSDVGVDGRVRGGVGIYHNRGAHAQVIGSGKYTIWIQFTDTGASGYTFIVANVYAPHPKSVAKPISSNACLTTSSVTSSLQVSATSTSTATSAPITTITTTVSQTLQKPILTAPINNYPSTSTLKSKHFENNVTTLNGQHLQHQTDTKCVRRTEFWLELQSGLEEIRTKVMQQPVYRSVATNGATGNQNVQVRMPARPPILMIGGDFNGRLRMNGDTEINSAGLEISEFANRNRLTVVNSVPGLARGQFSFYDQRVDYARRSTPDYVLIDTRYLDLVNALQIDDSTESAQLLHSDHRALILSLTIPTKPSPQHSRSKRPHTNNNQNTFRTTYTKDQRSERQPPVQAAESRLLPSFTSNNENKSSSASPPSLSSSSASATFNAATAPTLELPRQLSTSTATESVASSGLRRRHTWTEEMDQFILAHCNHYTSQNRNIQWQMLVQTKPHLFHGLSGTDIRYRYKSLVRKQNRGNAIQHDIECVLNRYPASRNIAAPSNHDSDLFEHPRFLLDSEKVTTENSTENESPVTSSNARLEDNDDQDVIDDEFK
jgi:hypothetical protein